MNKNKRPVRSSQLITTWGIGSIQSFPNDDSFMLLGLDAWNFMYNKMTDERRREHIIYEPRLARRLNVKSFRKPIIFDDQTDFQRALSTFMPYHRFPSWHWCPQCGQLKRLKSLSERNLKEPNEDTTCDKIFSPCKDNNEKVEMIPSRFVCICPNGHIDDFPYDWWLKKELEKQGKEIKEFKLRIIRGSYTSKIISMSLECLNNKIKVPLKDMYYIVNTNKGLKCNGKKPWLGIYNSNSKYHEECDSHMTVTYRNALNVHSKITKSSISMPASNNIFPERLISQINTSIPIIKNHPDTIDTYIDTFQGDYPQIQKSMIVSYINELLDENYSESKFRNEEYKILCSGGGSASDKLFYAEANSGYFDNKHLNKIIKSISVVHKLVETRAFVGFNRLVSGELPIISDDNDIEDLKSNLSLGNIDWLPAYQAPGEGIFINFNNEFITKWSNKKNVRERLDKLQNNYNRDSIQRGGAGMDDINPAYPLIHSFSHLLIDKLSYHAGYGASSLKEKLYVNFDAEEADNMSGLLIYTIGGGDGSMGGLCSLVDNNQLEQIIIDALLESTWCSSDPICIDSNGQGNGLCNLASCHNCILVPETSCESFNILLDRKMLIDTVDNCGIFSDLIKDELDKL